MLKHRNCRLRDREIQFTHREALDDHRGGVNIVTDGQISAKTPVVQRDRTKTQGTEVGVDFSGVPLGIGNNDFQVATPPPSPSTKPLNQLSITGGCCRLR